MLRSSDSQKRFFATFSIRVLELLPALPVCVATFAVPPVPEGVEAPAVPEVPPLPASPGPRSRPPLADPLSPLPLTAAFCQDFNSRADALLARMRAEPGPGFTVIDERQPHLP